MKQQAKNLFIFDFDGVLADSLDQFEAGVRRACAALGYPGIAADREKFLRLFEGNFYEGLLSAGMPATRGAEMMDLMGRHLPEVAATVRCFPGLRKVMVALSAKAVICVVTSNLAEVVQAILVREGMADFFAEISGARQGQGKVRRIAEMIARHPHDVVFYAGDTAGDMLEGRQAGAQTVAVTWGWHSRERLLAQRPDHVVEQPEDLLKLPGLNRTSRT